MTTTSVSSEPLSSAYLSNYSSTSSIHSFTRRHSIYGTEDRVVLDIGSLYIKCGFSGESHPRHLVPTWTRLVRSSNRDGEAFRMDGKLSELYNLNIMAKGNLQQLEGKLKKLLHDIYFRLLLTDPKSRKVIICESPLLPVVVKEIIARILFDYFQVPSLSFVPIHLMALMTTGLTTGLVIDCGHLETTVLPIYTARPLIPYISTTPLAGKAVTKRLTSLLLDHGRMIPPSNLHISLAPQVPIPPSVLTSDLLEEIKTRVLFCSTSTSLTYQQEQSTSQRRHDTLSRDERIEHDKTTSHATDLHFPIQLATTQEKATLLIPGWIREHAMDIVFEGNDEEDYKQDDDEYEFETGIAHCILNCLRKVPADLRKPMISSLLVVGGTALVPGFHNKLKQTLLTILKQPTPQESSRYSSLLGLASFIQFLDHPSQTGPLFQSNVRGWIGGSLMGSLKLSGEEMVKEKFNGSVTDWSIGQSIGHWSQSE
ncbi:actin family [Halteromyces radiatus]|uniref:actin family n=1 Tax=Halteromyces radiatus TaxID=101107 RepID=UPI00221FCD78|nr:actin family [Halteromyces radiatus]KAI8096588.1 actin family [Halteromyces radiatus]